MHKTLGLGPDFSGYPPHALGDIPHPLRAETVRFRLFEMYPGIGSIY